MKTRISVVLALTVVVSMAVLPWRGVAAFAQKSVTDELGPEPVPRAYLPVILSSYMAPNTAPDQPSDPSPPDSAQLPPTSSVDLAWTGGDPDGDRVTYDVYFAKYTFGGCNFGAPICAGIEIPLCHQGGLSLGATYCWQVIAWDEHGSRTPGEVWRFTIQWHNPPD